MTERRMILTEADIHAIAAEVESRHVCQYNVSPQDMNDLMAFVRSFRDTAIETRKTFKTAAIRMLVWGSIFGAISLLEVKFQWMRPLLRFITGSPG